MRECTLPLRKQIHYYIASVYQLSGDTIILRQSYNGFVMCLCCSRQTKRRLSTCYWWKSAVCLESDMQLEKKPLPPDTCAAVPWPLTTAEYVFGSSSKQTLYSFMFIYQQLYIYDILNALSIICSFFMLDKVRYTIQCVRLHCKQYCRSPRLGYLHP